MRNYYYLAPGDDTGCTVSVIYFFFFMVAVFSSGSFWFSLITTIILGTIANIIFLSNRYQPKYMRNDEEIEDDVDEKNEEIDYEENELRTNKNY